MMTLPEVEEMKAREQGTFRDYLIELGARALCKRNNCDPDYVPTGPHAQYTFIDGQPVPNWKHYAKNAATVIDAIFNQNKQRTAA